MCHMPDLPTDDIVPNADVFKVTREDIESLRRQFEVELLSMKEQITSLVARAIAMEAQLALIEPRVEARSSRTERLVMELQGELSRFSKMFQTRQSIDVEHQKQVAAKLDLVLEKLVEKPVAGEKPE
jgi:hypothetical protein